MKIGVHAFLNLLRGECGIWVPHLSSAQAEVSGRSLIRLLPGFLARSCVIRCASISQRLEMLSFPALEHLRTHGVGVSVQTSLSHHRVEIPNGCQQQIQTIRAEWRRAR